MSFTKSFTASFTTSYMTYFTIGFSFELFPHPPYSPDLPPSDHWLFTDLKIMLLGKRLGSNEEVIAETKTYFESKDESFYNKRIEKLEKHWNECITLERNYVDE